MTKQPSTEPLTRTELDQQEGLVHHKAEHVWEDKQKERKKLIKNKVNPNNAPLLELTTLQSKRGA